MCGLMPSGRIDVRQHLPLSQVPKEYAGAKNHQMLLPLPSPLLRAAEQSEFIRELADSGFLCIRRIKRCRNVIEKALIGGNGLFPVRYYQIRQINSTKRDVGDLSETAIAGQSELFNLCHG